MTIYLDDERDYSPVIEGWVREFVLTMDEDENLYPGNDSGNAPYGVKIIFDGFADLETEDENGEYVYQESADRTTKSFAVFVHKDSLTKEFPPHDITPWALIHRPKEEVCIWAWYDEKTDDVQIIPFEDNNSTDLDHNFIADLIFAIQKRDTEQ